MRVLFICGDNVGRSQAAEALFNKYAKRSTARSCAGKPQWKTERRVSEIETGEMRHISEVAEIMREDYGIDFSGRISKPFSKKMVDESDRIIVLCDPNDCPRIEGAEYWNIERLSPQDKEGKRKIIKGLDKKIKTLLKEIGE